MKKSYLVSLGISLLIILIYYVVQPRVPTSAKQQIVSSLTPTYATNSSVSHCVMHGLLPDPNCTPGSTNSAVTQANIHQTICVPGYTKTVRPPVDYTNSLKKEQITEYGYTDTNPHDYEEDHLISLELGGSPTDPKNLWPEPGASPNPKDDIENRCHEMVCNGSISLASAQKEIAQDWTTACKVQ